MAAIKDGTALYNGRLLCPEKLHRNVEQRLRIYDTLVWKGWRTAQAIAYNELLDRGYTVEQACGVSAEDVELRLQTCERLIQHGWSQTQAEHFSRE